MPANDLATWEHGTLSSQPGRRAAAVTPNDTTDLPTRAARALYIGTGGDVAVTAYDDVSGVSVVFKAVPQGTILPVACRRVWATGTTASNIVALS